MIPTLVCITVSGCSATTAGVAAPAAPTPPATASTLPALLLSPGDAAAAMGGGGLAITSEVAKPWNDVAHFQGADQRGCLAITGAAQRGVYADAGWTALHGRALREPATTPSWRRFITQAVALFPTAEAAERFFTTSRESWDGCSSRELRYAQQLAPDQVWAVGPISSDRQALAVSREQLSPQRWSCQRALTVRTNVVVDVEACSLDGPTTGAAAIAGRIADRLPAV